MKYLKAWTIVCGLLAGTAAAQDSRPDILVVDFEGETYGEWKAEGDAFGDGPAQGTLSGQMHVSGFKGKGLVNSFLKGDRTTGTLTSPPIKIERKYLTFLVGGGGHAGQTCMNLLVDGEVVHSVTRGLTEPADTSHVGFFRLTPKLATSCDPARLSKFVSPLLRATCGVGLVVGDGVAKPPNVSVVSVAPPYSG